MSSLMIGKQLNFNREFRQLDLLRVIIETTRDVVKQIGGHLEFSKLNVLQKKSAIRFYWSISR